MASFDTKTVDRRIGPAYPGRPRNGGTISWAADTDSPEIDISEAGIIGFLVTAAFGTATTATLYVGIPGSTVATTDTVDLTAAGYVEFDNYVAAQTLKLVLDGADTDSLVLVTS